jgi:hypothetical protein
LKSGQSITSTWGKLTQATSTLYDDDGPMTPMGGDNLYAVLIRILFFMQIFWSEESENNICEFINHGS